MHVRRWCMFPRYLHLSSKKDVCSNWRSLRIVLDSPPPPQSALARYSCLSFVKLQVLVFIASSYWAISFTNPSGLPDSLVCLPAESVQLTPTVCLQKSETATTAWGRRSWEYHQYLFAPSHHYVLSTVSIYLSIYLSHSLGDRWGTTRPGN